MRRPTSGKRSATSGTCSRPGGLLVLLEVVKPARWIDLVFGLTEGWWRFSDQALRPSYPLLTFDGWNHLLDEFGFSDTVDVASAAKVEGFGSAVIFARGPAAVEQPPTEADHHASERGESRDGRQPAELDAQSPAAG